MEYCCPMKFYLLPNKDGMICLKSTPANINNICLPMANNLIKCRAGRKAQLSTMTQALSRRNTNVVPLFSVDVLVSLRRMYS